MPFEYFKPRSNPWTTELILGKERFAKISATQSPVRAWEQKRHFNTLIRDIRHIANAMPKVEKKTLDEHVIKEALESQEKVIRNIGPVFEITMEAYDNNAERTAFIIKEFNGIFGIRFIPSAEKFREKIHVRNGRGVGQAEVTLVDAPRTLMANVGPLDKRHAKVELGTEMGDLRKIDLLLSRLERVNPDQKAYEENLKAYFQEMKSRKDTAFKGKSKEVYMMQRELIIRIEDAIYNNTEFYNDVALLEADIDKISRTLAKVDWIASDPANRLLPPKELYRFQQVMLRYLPPFVDWLSTAVKDQFAFEKAVEELAKRVRYDPNVKLLQYRAFTYVALQRFDQWLRNAFEDQRRLLANCTTSLKEFEALSARLRTSTLTGGIARIR